MKMVPYDYKKLGSAHAYSTKNIELVEEFESSDFDCVEIVGYRHKNANVCCHSLNKTIERSRIGGIKCVIRKGHVFLVKTSVLESLLKD